PDVGDFDHLRDLLDLGEEPFLSALAQERLELEGDVEMVLDRHLAAARDEEDLVDPGIAGFLDRVLDQRLVDEGEHLLRLRLGRGEKPGAESRGGEDGFSNARHRRENSKDPEPERAASTRGWPPRRRPCTMIVVIRRLFLLLG